MQRELLSMGITVESIHAERSQEQRDKIVRAFREGKLPFLICSELMGRGIDFKAVNQGMNTLLNYYSKITFKLFSN